MRLNAAMRPRTQDAALAFRQRRAIVTGTEQISFEGLLPLVRAARKALSARDFPAIRICSIRLAATPPLPVPSLAPEVAKAIRTQSRIAMEQNAPDSSFPTHGSPIAPAVGAMQANQPAIAETKASKEMKRHQRIKKPVRKFGIGCSWRSAPKHHGIVGSIMELIVSRRAK